MADQTQINKDRLLNAIQNLKDCAFGMNASYMPFCCSFSNETHNWDDKKFGEFIDGTLVNLQNYCDATNLSPNDVLLASGSSINNTELIEYIAYEAAAAIANYVEKNPSVVKGSYSFPLIYAPREMILLSMEIYAFCGAQRQLVR